MAIAPRYVLQDDYERDQDRSDTRLEKLVGTVEQLSQIANVTVQRVTAIEKQSMTQSDRTFTQSLSAGQLVGGCLVSVLMLVLTTVASVLTSLIVSAVHH